MQYTYRKYLHSFLAALGLLVVSPLTVNAGSQTYDVPGTYSFTVPAGVTQIFLTASGGGGQGAPARYVGPGMYGGGGGGAGVSIVNFPFSVTPGNSYSLTVGGAGEATSFQGAGSLPGGANAGTAPTPGAGGGPGEFNDGITANPYYGTSGGTGGSNLVGTGGNQGGWSPYVMGECLVDPGQPGYRGGGGAGASMCYQEGRLYSGVPGDGGDGFLKVDWVDPTFGTINVSSNIGAASYTITGPTTIVGAGASATYSSRPTGSYTIVWNAVPGYDTPATDSKTLSTGGAIAFSGSYTASLPKCVGLSGDSLEIGPDTCPALGSSCTTPPFSWQCRRSNFRFSATCNASNCLVTPTASLTITPPGSPYTYPTGLTYTLASSNAQSCEVKNQNGDIYVTKASGTTSIAIGPVDTAVGTWTFTTQCWSGPNGSGMPSPIDTDTIVINCPSGTSWNAATFSCVSTAPTATITSTGPVAMEPNSWWQKALSFITGSDHIAHAGGTTTIAAGQNARIDWSSTNATSCTISGSGAAAGYSNSGLSGGQQFNNMSAGVYTYAISCTGPGGSVNDSTTITVNPATCSWGGGDLPTWGGNCTAYVAPTTINIDESFGPIANTASGYSGFITYNCTAGGWTTSGVSCNPLPTAPGIPTGLSTNPGACSTGTINVSWNASAGATSYQLRDGASIIYDGSGTSFAHTSLSAGSGHSYTVQAVNGVGSSGYSGSVAATAPALCGPFVCTGSMPTGGELYSGDDASLGADTPYTYSGSNTSAKCQYYCGSGYTWTGMTCQPVAATGSITAPGCTIASGASTCNSTISWTTTGASAPRMYQEAVQFSTSASGSQARTLQFGSNNFSLYDGGTLLDSKIANANCIAGTSWNGSSCQPGAPTVIDFTNTGPILVGQTATLQYNVSGWDTCQITRHPEGTNLGSSFGGNIGIGSRLSDVLSATRTYRLTCTSAVSGTQFRDTVVVVGVGTPTISLSSTSCTIPVGQSNCGPTLVTWTNATTPTAIKYTYTNPGPGTLYNGTTTLSSATNGSTTQSIYYGSNNVFWNDQGGVASPVAFATGSCAAGSTWNGALCQAVGVSGTIMTFTNPCIIAVGQSGCTFATTWATSLVGPNVVSVGVRSADNTRSQFFNFNGSDSYTWSAASTYPGAPIGTWYVRLVNNATGAILDEKPFTVQCAGGSTWNGSTCVTAPTVNLTINGSTGPLSVSPGNNLAISWTTTNTDVTTTCTATSGAGWAGGTKSRLGGGPDNVPASVSSTYTLSCTKPPLAPVSSSVTVNLSCAVSCTAWTACGPPCAGGDGTQSRSCTSATCVVSPENRSCTTDVCRDLNWKEVGQ